MHESQLALAALPAAARVCGLPLKPFSIGHSLHLIRDNSPFVTEEAILPGDVFKAVWICASTWDELKYRDHLHMLKLWLLKRLVKKSDHTESVQLLGEYFREGSLELPMSDITRPDREKATREVGAPFLLRLQQFLMIHLRLSESEAWDYPLGLAKMRWQTFWEQEGGCAVRGETECKMDAMLEGAAETHETVKEAVDAGN
jgi:hypothetical protein